MLETPPTACSAKLPGAARLGLSEGALHVGTVTPQHSPLCPRGLLSTVTLLRARGLGPTGGCKAGACPLGPG